MKAAYQQYVHKSVRGKISLALLGIMLIVVLVLLIPLRYIVNSSSLFAEQQEMQDHLERVRRAIDSELSQIDALVLSMATWDESYDFINQRTPTYIEENTNDEVFELYNVQAMLYTDQNGTIVFAKTYDPQQGKPVAVPFEFFDINNFYPQLLNHPQLDQGKTSVVRAGTKLWLLAARPILTSDAQGPSRGTLIYGRMVDQAVVDRINYQTLLPVELSDYRLLAPTRQQIVSELANEQRLVSRAFNDNTLEGFVVFPSIDGKPLLVATLALPRTIYIQGERTFWLIASVVGIAGCLGLLSLFWALRRFIFYPLASMVGDLRQIDPSQPDQHQINFASPDELGLLAKTVNQALDSLAIAQREQLAAEAKRSALQAEMLQNQQSQLQTQAALLELQEQSLAEQALPLIPVSREVLAMPLIGQIDLNRAERLQTTILHGIETYRARTVILDLTGISQLEQRAAVALGQTAQAVQLLGARLLLTGANPAIAEEIVAANIDLGQIAIYQTLAAGMQAALR
ncbi:MAG: STAS domain-containing protein [Chloroflexi bacterium]|nr:STAS domain-containing protein [Chloroflexota bacterium]